MKTSVHGILVIDKPAGPTSFDVVRSVRRLLQVKKVGHLGTLDPFAAGVLPLLLGEATKLVPYLPDDVKSYRGTLELGVETDTLDLTGTVTARSPHLPDPAAVGPVLESFRGDQWQTPPLYSALHHQGQRLYQLARRGLQVEIPPRQVRISHLECEAVALPRVTFRVTCSRGTYVRTLAADIGRRLGCGAHLVSLARLASGPFTLDQAVPLPAPGDPAGRETLLEHLVPLARAVSHLPAVAVDAAAARRLRQGQAVPCPPAPQGERPPAGGDRLAVLHHQELIAVCEVGGEPGSLALLPRRVFPAQCDPPTAPRLPAEGVRTLWPQADKDT